MSDKRPDPSSFKAVLVEKEGRFFFYQPEIGVIASDTTLAGAYDKFLDSRRAFLLDVERAGVTVGTAPTAAAVTAVVQGGHRSIAAELGLFLAKFALVLLVVGGLGAVVGSAVGKAVGNLVASISPALEGIGKISLADVSTKAADIARDAKNLPPERKELLRQSVGAISRELDPVVQAWRNPPPASDNPPQ